MKMPWKKPTEEARCTALTHWNVGVPVGEPTLALLAINGVVYSMPRAALAELADLAVQVLAAFPADGKNWPVGKPL